MPLTCRSYERRARGTASLLAFAAVSVGICWLCAEPIRNSAFVAGVTSFAGAGRDASLVIRGARVSTKSKKSKVGFMLDSDGMNPPVHATRSIVRSMVPVGVIAKELREASDVDLHAAVIAGKLSQMQRRFDSVIRKPLSDQRDLAAQYKMRVATNFLYARKQEVEKSRKAEAEARRPETQKEQIKSLPTMVESLERRGIWTRNDTISAWRNFAKKPRSYFQQELRYGQYGKGVYPNGPYYENNQDRVARHDTAAEIEFAEKNGLELNYNLYDAIPMQNIIKYKDYKTYTPRHLDKNSPTAIWIRTGVPIDQQVAPEPVKPEQEQEKEQEQQ